MYRTGGIEDRIESIEERTGSKGTRTGIIKDSTENIQDRTGSIETSTRAI